MDWDKLEQSKAILLHAHSELMKLEGFEHLKEESAESLLLIEMALEQRPKLIS